MAVEHQFVTAVYAEVYDLLQAARDVVDPLGGKKMSDAVFQSYLSDVVTRDLELDALVKDLVWMRRELASLNAAGAQTHEELSRIKLKFRLIEWDFVFNDINIKRVFEHAKFLKGDLMAHYVA